MDKNTNNQQIIVAAPYLTVLLENNIELITPNTRLAASLHNTLDSLAFQKQNIDVSQSFNVISFQQWFENLRNQFLIAGLIEAREILSPLAESAIWQSVIECSESGGLLLAPALAAAEAQKSYRLLCEWCIDIESNAFEISSQLEGEALLEWIKIFRQNLTQKNVISRVDAQIELMECIKKLKKESRPVWLEQQAKIYTLGFQTPTPIQKHFFECFNDINTISSDNNLLLEEQLKTLSTTILMRQCESVTVECFDDFDAEITTAAQWANNIHQQQPNARIAIVVPDLEHRRAQVERVMRKQYEPESVLLGQQNLASAYNISAGMALGSTAVVAVYLNVIQGTLHNLPVEQWQSVLTSPYLCNNTNTVSDQRLLIEAMYASGEDSFALTDLLRVLQWHYKKSDFTALLEKSTFFNFIQLSVQQAQSITAYRQRDRRELPSVWLKEFDAILQKFYWLNTRTLSSNEFQQQQRFHESCQIFCQLDDVIGDISAVKALKFLRQHLMATVYHRQTVEHGIEIPQVLGTLEASGLTFDHLWLLGFSDAQWPVKAKPNSLIPLGLQQRVAMPSSSEQREFEYARGSTQNFLSAAKTIFISFPSVIDDVATYLSPVVGQCLDDLVKQNNTSSVAVKRADLSKESDRPNCVKLNKLSIKEKVDFEYIDDFFGADIKTEKQKNKIIQLRGGASRLKAVAKNPLRAYFQYRLGVLPLPPRTTGITPLERGIAVHKILEVCWYELSDQQTLDKLNQTERESLIDSALDKELPKVFANRYKPLLPRMLLLEQQTIKNLVSTWLAFETERKPFWIDNVEHSFDLEISELSFSVKIDRIDRLEDGSYLLLDYKTGNISTSGWFDEQLTEPQLPFYAQALSKSDEAIKVLGSGKIGGIAFASLKPGNVCFKGLANEDSVAADIVDIKTVDKQRNVFANWQSVEKHWGLVLDQLAENIKTGFAAIDEEVDCSDDPYEPIMRSAYCVGSTTISRKEFNDE